MKGKKIKKMMTNIRIRKLQRKQERGQSKKKRPLEQHHDRGIEENVHEDEHHQQHPSPKQFETNKKIKMTKSAHSHDMTITNSTTKRHNKESSKTVLINPREDHLLYSALDSNTAAELQKEDAEIADLEAKLGLGKKKEKLRLHKEYAKLEGYGDDFGDFLDDLDTLVSRVVNNGSKAIYAEDYSGTDDENEDDHEDFDEEEIDQSDGGNEDFSEPDEEMIPMKRGAFDEDDDHERINDDSDDDHLNHHDTSDDDSDVDDEDGQNSEAVRDHDVTDTYRPIDGEDIYGHSVADNASESVATKYIPPHLRHHDDSQDRKEKLLMLQRLLNNALNRLSEDTLISVAQSVVKLYQDFPSSDVNQNLWKNVVAAAVDRPMLMVGMIPVYVACLAGVHFQTGDTVQLGGYLIENIIVRLWKMRMEDCTDESKEPSNLILCVCYLYNFGLVHAVFMFDIVRSLIDSFSELDIELLLLILSHAGQALRSDDPLALKEIVLSVQTKKSSTSEVTSSRIEFMVSAMTDLKNNKRRKQDTVYSERTVKLRKFLGRIKADTDKSFDSSCLRIRLNDILNVESKGRWWKVGASWVGNQFKHQSDGEQRPYDAEGRKAIQSSGNDEVEEELLKLAAKYRMNTDSRRAVFCIIMGSADCEDAFEKLVRSGLLKDRSERDCVRVLIECCGNESYYNPFYAHLAARICDYQPQCKFTFQLAFWDMFKQWEMVSERKAVNLAKLLHHLVAIHQSLKLNILKPLDTADLEDTALIFMVAFFSTMFETVGDSSQVFNLFERGIPKPKPGKEEDDSNALRESLSVFFLQTLKSSPKNKKKSPFRSNLKAAIKACEINELDLMVPATDM